MNKVLLLLCLTFSLLAQPVWAQVSRAQLASGVEDREPVDDLGQQIVVKQGTVAKVFFFTHIKDLANHRIIHRWIHKGEERAAVELNIGSDDWRTYSSKNIPWQWQGEWQVQVWLDDLRLTSYEFTVTAN